MANYTNFNRQSNFSRIELAFLSNTVRTFLDVGGMFADFPNKLQGLYDGYYYHGLLELCDEFIKQHEAEAKADGVYVKLHRAKADLKLIVDKVEALPQITQTEAHNLV